MSNKPKIYASCKSGCLWETVHKDDFIASAAYIPQTKQNGVYKLEQGKTYIVHMYESTIMLWYARVVQYTTGGALNFTGSCNVEYDKYSPKVKMRFCGVEYTYNGSSSGFTGKAVFEINGERRYGAFSDGGDYSLGSASGYITVESAESVMLLNEDAQAKATDGADGKSAFIMYSKYADGNPCYAQWSEGMNYVGFATARDYPTNVAEFTWVRIADLVNVKNEMSDDVNNAPSLALLKQLLAEKFDNANVSQVMGKSTTKVPSEYAVANEIRATQKRLENVEAALIGDAVTPTVDSTLAYRKTVPANVLPNAAVCEIGGMSYKCENLIPFPYKINSGHTVRGVTATIADDGGISISGTFDYTQVMNVTIASGILLGAGTYYLSANYRASAPFAIIAAVVNDAGAVSYMYADSTPIIIDTSATVEIILQYAVGATYSNDMCHPMLNPGKTALPHQPYFTGLRDSKVTAVESVGSNILPKGLDYCWQGNGTVDEDGQITATRNASGGVCYTKLKDVYLEAGKEYTITYSGSNIEYASFIRKENDTHIDTIYGTKTITVTRNGFYFLRLYMSNSLTAVGNTASAYVWVNKGSTALPYSPYFKNTFEIPEAVQAMDGYGQGVPNTTHYNKVILNPAEGVKKFVNITKQVVFTGTENWIASDYGDVYVDANAKLVNDTAMLICDRYNSVSFNDRINSTNAIAYIAPISTTRTGIFFRNTGYSTVNEWKAYLAEQYAAGTPVTVDYVLNESIETDLTPYFTDDNLIGVEAYGEVTAVNEHEQAVPFTVEYTVKGV